MKPTTGLDANALRGLQTTATRDPKAAVLETAKQFEALFMQQILKSMRESTMQSGMLENSGTQMGTELLDAQLAQKLSGLPGGLGSVIARQLERQIDAVKAGAEVGALEGKGPSLNLPKPAAAAGSWERLPGSVPVSSSAQDFVARHSAAAEKVSAETGIPAAFILSQAAHESGWGKKQILHADGSSSHNLFGIKAGESWKGASTTITTTEVIGGEAQKVKASFRAYESTEDSFRDWARLIKNSPRYAKVIEQGGTAEGFATGLQRAGYATDPEYAAKLGRVINTTLRLQRSQPV